MYATTTRCAREKRPALLRFVCGTIICEAASLSIMTTGGFAKDFGKLVRALREQRGMSQEDLADAAALHRTHISLIERGQRTVRIDTVARLAFALRVQPGDLMPKIKLPAK